VFGCSFIRFCRLEHNNILKSIEMASRGIPPEMNKPDYRFHISHLLCYTIVKPYVGKNVLESSYNVGYDLMYNNKDRISVKIQTYMFQQPLKKSPNRLTTAKSIVIKNKLGNNSQDPDVHDLEFDYLMTIQRGNNRKGTMDIGFAVISREDIPNLRSSGDQITTSIPNDGYNYFSGLHSVSNKNYLDIGNKLDKEFHNGLGIIYNNLLDVVKEELV